MTKFTSLNFERCTKSLVTVLGAALIGGIPAAVMAATAGQVVQINWDYLMPQATLVGVSIQDSGNYALTWENGDLNLNPYNFVRTFDPDSNPLIDGPQVKSGNVHTSPSTALSPDNSFATAWVPCPGTQSATDLSIYDPSGKLIVKNLPVASVQMPGGCSLNAFVGTDKDGDYRVVWTTVPTTEKSPLSSTPQPAVQSSTIYTQAYAADGTPKGTTKQLEQVAAANTEVSTKAPYGNADVVVGMAMNKYGNFVLQVVRHRAGKASNSVIAFGPDATPASPLLSVGAVPTSYTTAPVIDANGNFAIGTSPNTVSRFGANGAARGKVTLFDAAAGCQQVGIGLTQGGELAAGWACGQSGSYTYQLGYFGTDGSADGSPVTLFTGFQGSPTRPLFKMATSSMGRTEAVIVNNSRNNGQMYAQAVTNP